MHMSAMIAALTGALMLFAAPCCAQTPQAADATAASQQELVIGTKEAAPFAMKAADGNWSGISIDLWRRIADDLHLHYRFVEEASVQTLIDGVAAGRFDMAVAALTVTAERERVLDFTQAFYVTGLGIAVPASGEASWRPIIRTLTSFGFAQAIMALVGLALVVGFVVWLFERRHNDDFSGGAARGISSGVWWSAMTMTQRGAGSFRSANAARAHRRGAVDDRLDRRHRRVHRRHHFGADDQAPAGRGARQQRSVGCSCRRGRGNLHREHAVAHADKIPEIPKSAGRPQGVARTQARRLHL